MQEHVTDTLVAVLPAGSSILLGLSGGMDSVVLLHILHQISPQRSWLLSALHVHHGISPKADAWAAFCSDLCARLDVPLRVERVDITPLRHMGIEAAARELRHAALTAQPVDYIALAHHQDDQAETLLLQLLRGAGVKGAAAMPLVKLVAAPTPFPSKVTNDLAAVAGQTSQMASSFIREGGGESGIPSGFILRPLLDVSRAELVAYAKQHELAWVEDESNADDSYPRNFLRQRVMPLLMQRFPACSETLARSAQHFAEASELLDQLAQLDTQGAMQGDTLDVSCLRRLDTVRAKNLLRFFIASRGAPMPGSARLQEMLHQLCDARADAAPCVAFGAWEVRRYQGRVYVFPTLAHPDTTWQVQWNGESELALPQLGGTLHFESCAGQGLSLKKLEQGVVMVRLRQGAERMQPDARRPVRSLKNLLQEHEVPPWRRDSLPLLFCDDELAAVPGLGVACAYQATLHERGVQLRWAA